jgi:ABC-type multidrug transport system fused ATPase/permease subunit
VIVWRVAIWLLWSLEAKMVESLYRECFDHLSRQSATFYSDRFVGSMVSAINKFTGAYILVADTIVFGVAPLLTAVVVPIVVIGPQIPLSGVEVVAVTSAFALFAAVTYRPVARLTAAEAERHTAIGGRVSDVLSNALVVKSFAREADENDGFRGYTGVHRRATLDVMRNVIRRDIGLGLR